MAEFDDLDVSTEIRFRHSSEHIEAGVAEGEIFQVIQTSVGKAYKVKLEDNHSEEDEEQPHFFVSPDQVLTVVDYEVVFEAENWQLVKQDDEYFFDPITGNMVAVEFSEIFDALEKLEGDTC